MFEGLKTTLWSGLAVAISIISIIYFQAYWLVKVPVIEQVLLGLFFVGIVISAQFSRSRFTILTVLMCLYYAIYQEMLTGKDLLGSYTEWFYVTTLFFIAYLSVVKDRALFSVHGLYRIVAFLGSVILAKLWLIFSAWCVAYATTNYPQFISKWHITQVAKELPLVLVSLFVLYKSLRRPSLLVASLLTSIIVALLVYRQQIDLPLSVLFTYLMCHFLVVIVIDSYYLAYRDELTNLPSRRALNQYALSLGRKYCVAMLDIDHFKKFNDNYGHDIGDQVLKLVAAKLAELKGGGRVFRYGGEEFTAIFPRKEAESIFNELEVLRLSVANYGIVIRHPVRKTKKARDEKNINAMKTVNVTISIGVATRKAKGTFEETVKLADEALYRAKKKGRNQVCY